MKLTAIGDSIVKGYLVDKSFVEDLGLDTLNIAINGLRSKDLIEIAQAMEYSELVLVHIGINDFLYRLSLEELLDNIYKIIEILKEKSEKIIIVSPMKIAEDESFLSELIVSTNNKLRKYNDIIKSLKSEKVYALSYYDLFIGEENYEDLFIDGIHPTQKTHDMMRNYLKEMLGEINGLF